MTAKTVRKPAAPKAPKVTKAPAKAAPAATPAAPEPKAPVPYTLTDAGKALAPRHATARAAAWAILVRHAGKPDGAASLKAEIATTPNCGAITGANLLGWARKAGLVA